jgi:hypothetical protein
VCGRHEVIGDFNFLNSAYLNIGGEFGITEFFTHPGALFVTKEIEAQDSESQGIEKEAYPSTGSAGLSGRGCAQIPIVLIWFICHFDN